MHVEAVGGNQKTLGATAVASCDLTCVWRSFMLRLMGISPCEADLTPSAAQTILQSKRIVMISAGGARRHPDHLAILLVYVFCSPTSQSLVVRKELFMCLIVCLVYVCPPSPARRPRRSWRSSAASSACPTWTRVSCEYVGQVMPKVGRSWHGMFRSIRCPLLVFFHRLVIACLPSAFVFNSEEYAWSGWNALCGALKAGGP